MRYQAAAIQFNPVLGEYERNVDRILALTEEAAAAGARLVVLPEMATCGYCFYDREEVAPCVEPVPGPLTEGLEETARRFGCVIVCGLAEVEESSGLYYNTAVIVGPDGYIGKYRKIHFFSSDAKWGVEGDLGFPVWDTPLGRIGIEVCMDATYPEAGRALAVQGADVVCYPTNWVGSVCPEQRWISQAFENGVYWIAADRSDVERGLQFMGGSCIINPNGTVQAVAEAAEQIVYGEIDLAQTRERRFDGSGPEDKLADRRPELYREMLQNTYGWSSRYYHTLYGAPGLPEPRASCVGVLQFLPDLDAPDMNIETIHRLLEGQELALAVLPELALTGLPGGRELQPTDLRPLVDLARERDMLIATTAVKQAAGQFYHTALLIGPSSVLVDQPKTHLNRDDIRWASAGEHPPKVVDTPLGRVGVLAGYDALFFENLRILATQGADLLCVPAALCWPREQPLPGSDRRWIFWRTKAWESCTALAIANYPGPEFAGGSGIFIPEVREDRSEEAVMGADGEGIITATVDTHSRYMREKRGLSWRRLHWYKPLVEQAGATLTGLRPRPPIVGISQPRGG